MDIYELHKWLDKCDSPDASISSEAKRIVKEWNDDIQPNQMWRLKDSDETICEILSVDKKIKVKIDFFSDQDGDQGSIFYFGKVSFLNKWERMF